MIAAPFLTIAEIVNYKQPEVLRPLVRYCWAGDVTEHVVAAAWLTADQHRLARIMQEPPKGGRRW